MGQGIEWERERGGDEDGMLRQAQHNAYPPARFDKLSAALPTLRQAQGKHGKGVGRVMAVVIFHTKATFDSGGFGLSPLGETGEGFPCFALQSRHAD